MPTYEYVCRSCGHLFEIVQSMRDDPLTECPECGGELRKVFAPPAISFKGSGFYATDHGKKKTTAPSGEKKADGSATPAATKEGPKGGSPASDPASGGKQAPSSSSSSSTASPKEGSSS